MKRIIPIICCVLITFNTVSGQPVLTKKAYKVTRTTETPVIDGVINDDEWKSGEWGGDFIQFKPSDGNNATQKTEFKVLFDENNIYVAIKAFDSSPDSIVKRISRRDNCDGDWVGIAFDSYHDLRTAFLFFVSAAGTKGDEIMTNDGNNEDGTWDAIWSVKTKIFDWGYDAEMSIPLSQLRFELSDGGVWGVNVIRTIARNEEQSFWSYIPRSSSGIVHLFGEATGLEGIHPRKQADITPFAVASFENSQQEEGNPFATGKKYKLNGGVDGKIGVTNNMTLDFTINPDFGQVEADPSEVNLTAFETFFEEKRPFFVEGKNITSFPVGFGNGDNSNENLFYSRRIGRSPHLEAETEENEYSKSPLNTSIIGATKITGKTKDGLSIGILEAVTAKEKADIDSLGERSKQTIEPLTNFFVARVMKDLNEGNTIIGGGFTNTHRFLDGTGIDGLTTSANTGGIDFTQYFDNKKWYVSLTTAFSIITGEAYSIEQLQRSSVHLYQRTDADYVEVDPSRKSLGGHGGTLQLWKMEGNWKFAFMGRWKSPGLDLNDVGYLRSADDLSFYLWSQYSINKPFGIFRNMSFNANQWNNWDWGGTHLITGANLSARATFTNLWTLSLTGNYSGNSISNTLLRGGPSIILPARLSGSIYAYTNQSKKLFFLASLYNTRGAENYYENTSVGIEAHFKPGQSFTLSLEPSISFTRNNLQYVTRASYQEQSRYILATIKQKITMMSIRLNYTITPELTVQYWGQPFIASMDYNDFKRASETKADNYNDRFHLFQGEEISFNESDNSYNIDENSDGTSDYNFDNPDNNYNEFLSNFVIRWEYRPASTVFLVWSQTREYVDPLRGSSLNDNVNKLFTANKPYNIFLIKFTYRFGLS